MIVNTASKCGLTPQYKDLEAIYKEYNQNFVIIGFRLIILDQEGTNNEEIASFANKLQCFMMDKVSVRR
jgi:glutathione peroxidase